MRRRLGSAAPTVAGESAFTEEATKRTEPSPAAQPSRSARVLRATPTTAGTVPPVAVPTSAGAGRSALRPRRSDWLAALAGIAVVAVGFVVVRGRRADGRGARLTPRRGPSRRPAAPAAPAVAATPPARPEVQVRVRVETTPPGASVRTVPDDDDLGVTPLVLERAPGTELPIRIVLPGFRGALRTLRFDTAATEEVRLEKAAAPRDRDGPYRAPSRL